MMEWVTGAALLLLLVVVLLNIFGLLDVLELVASVVNLLMALTALLLTGFAWAIRKATRLIDPKKDAPPTNDNHPPK